jgi:ATP-dependent Lon protease
MSETNRTWSARRRRTKSGEAAPPPDNNNNNNNKKKYNLRSQKKNKKTEESVRWVDDDTLFDEDTEDSSYHASASESDEEDSEKSPDDTVVHGISVPNQIPVSVKIHLHKSVDEYDYGDYEDDEDDDYDENDDADDEDGFDEGDEITEEYLTQLLARKLGSEYGRPTLIISGDRREKSSKQSPSSKHEDPPLKLSRREKEYFDEQLGKREQKVAIQKMKKVSALLGESEIPYKFRVLEMDMPPKIQCEIIRKIDAMTRMGAESGESQKLRNWVDGVLRIPFGKQVPLPVTLKDGETRCAEFLKNARAKMDRATYGMVSAKTQILQILAQWISNPSSVGNVIAMRGSMGVGKTSFARNGIAEVLNRPFIFTSLGGASDIAHYTGHSYTYEGSMWGRIVDAIIQAGCMNPVLYFDELDKVSGTPHGEEIISMLIHLTDRSQNSQFHDRYFAGIDFDLSQCLFVFSFNDENKVHPVLKDRMRVINVPGYKETEKKVIVANYIWPDILKHAGIPPSELSATEDAAEFIIREFSKNEEGMRNLIRVVEAVVSRINLIRISDEESAKAYKFWIPVKLPMKLDRKMVETLLTDFDTAMPEHWRSMYT